MSIRDQLTEAALWILRAWIVIGWVVIVPLAIWMVAS